MVTSLLRRVCYLRSFKIIKSFETRILDNVADRTVVVSLFYLPVAYHDLEHVDSKRNAERQNVVRRKVRHIGVPDHGGIQRLIATGGITKALNAKTDRFGYSDSIDVIFPVYWMYPAKTRVLTEKDIQCVKAYRERAKKGMYGILS